MFWRSDRTTAGILLLAVGCAAAAGAEKPPFEGGYHRDEDGERIAYRLFRPETKPGRQYPLVVMLHGNGDQGNSTTIFGLPWMAGLGPFSIPEVQAEHPCFVLRPRCRAGERWSDVEFGLGPQPRVEMTPSMRLTLELVDQLADDLPVDPERIYLTGYSMGGYGTWDAITRFPEKFAAAVAIAGSGDPTKAPAAGAVPVYVAHSRGDGLVPVRGSLAMIAAVRDAGGRPKYVEYARLGHNPSIAKAMNDRRLIPWLFDDTPPAPAAGLTAEAGEHAVTLKWRASEDAESGPVFYRVHRDGEPVGIADEPTYTDRGLAADTAYAYTVTAVNTRHLAAEPSKAVAARTRPDTSPPRVTGIEAPGPMDALIVRFDEPVEQASAGEPGKYRLDGEPASAAEVAADGMSVRLTVPSMTPATEHTLTVAGVRDRAAEPHAIADGASETVRYDPGWLACWRFDRAGSGQGIDAAGRMRPIWITGPTVVDARGGKALRFDGEADWLAAPPELLAPDDPAASPHAPLTISAWVRGAGPVFVSNDSDYGLYWGVALEVTDAGRLRLGYGLGGETGPASAYKIGTVAIDPDEWTHVAVVIRADETEPSGEGEVPAATLYVNGRDAGGRFTGDGGRIRGGGQRPVIGRSSFERAKEGTRRHFRGELDDLILYGRALSAEELRHFAGLE